MPSGGLPRQPAARLARGSRGVDNVVVRKLFIVFATMAVLAGAAIPFFAPSSGAQDDGWIIERFHVDLAIHEDGTVGVTELIAVDFDGLQRHGILRDLPLQYEIEGNDEQLRRIPLSNFGVSDGEGRPVRWTSETPQDGWIRLRIGDPNVFVTGRQSYVIQYTVERGLSAFPGHDELFWNVTGDGWPVPIAAASASVTGPGEMQRVACFIGVRGSTEECGMASPSGASATFDGGRTLGPGEGMSVVVALPKALVRVDAPLLVDKPKEFIDYLGLGPMGFGAAGFVGMVAVAAVGREWYVRGRDRRYRTVYQLTGDAAEDSASVFQHETIVVEYTPPDDLRPAELGVVIDERADTLDVSATIIDLAVREYLTITEVEKTGWIFSSTDYELVRTEKEDGDLLPYERRILRALFEGQTMVRLSDLKNKFYEDLARAKKDLYARSVRQGHFPRDPETARRVYAIAGGVIAAAGVGVGYVLGIAFDLGIAGAGIVVGGLLLMLAARWMPRRTAKGRELYRRALGFKEFIEVAERDRQRFYEEEGIFEKYLPFAMVFGSVKKWAGVFEKLDIDVSEPSFYHGRYGAFHVGSFASSLSDFGGTVGGVLASNPSSGGSGFSGGGGSGGGGGGGGGGSW